MFLSVFDMFKIGIGPSSSHTIGPMISAARFLDHLRGLPFGVAGLRASLHGSLAFTGVGHATDRAVILGLAGFVPSAYDATRAEAELLRIKAEGHVEVEGLGTLRFLPDTDLVFDYSAPLPGHANGLRLMATDAQGDVIAQETYYSIGGGFVVTEAELGAEPPAPAATFPYPFATAAEMLQMARASGKSIAQMKRANELALMGPNALDDGMRRIWAVMRACIDRGLETDGTLPGGLNVKRRAKAIREALERERGLNLTAPHVINDWISTYAMAEAVNRNSPTRASDAPG
ncbi:serine dehydratase beta chain, partial [Roseinatronobacter sp.]|uniref:serine dehydratase beta chain n=1 Tax=Roseinatronobacter sp. TaxID=1945755 RepID=UPI0025E0C073